MNPGTQSSSTSALVTQVLESIADSFNQWNSLYCRATLSRLGDGSSGSRMQILESAPELTEEPEDLSSGGHESLISPQQPSGSIVITSADGSINNITPQIIEMPSEVAMDPTPSYEYCAPITRSRYKGDDDNYMEFVPFADDPDFDFQQYDEDHYWHIYAWQRNTRNPDRNYLLNSLISSLTT